MQQPNAQAVCTSPKLPPLQRRCHAPMQSCILSAQRLQCWVSGRANDGAPCAPCATCSSSHVLKTCGCGSSFLCDSCACRLCVACACSLCAARVGAQPRRGCYYVLAAAAAPCAPRLLCLHSEMGSPPPHLLGAGQTVDVGEGAAARCSRPSALQRPDHRPLRVCMHTTDSPTPPRWSLAASPGSQ